MRRSESGCPVCGRDHTSRACNPRVLRGIDGAHTRAWNIELDPLQTPTEHRTLARRLREGFEMLQDDDVVRPDEQF